MEDTTQYMSRQEAKQIMMDLVPTATNTVCMEHGEHIGPQPLHAFSINVYVGVPEGQETTFNAVSFIGWEECINKIRAQVEVAA